MTLSVVYPITSDNPTQLCVWGVNLYHRCLEATGTHTRIQGPPKLPHPSQARTRLPRHVGRTEHACCNACTSQSAEQLGAPRDTRTAAAPGPRPSTDRSSLADFLVKPQSERHTTQRGARALSVRPCGHSAHPQEVPALRKLFAARAECLGACSVKPPRRAKKTTKPRNRTRCRSANCTRHNSLKSKSGHNKEGGRLETEPPGNGARTNRTC